jgi:hypothetical protein
MVVSLYFIISLFFIADHYDISNVCNNTNEIPFNPAGSVIMHSPAYTPFSSPRCKAYKQHTESWEDTGKYTGARVMVFNTTFNNISVIYRGSQFYRWRKPECTQMVGSFINPLLDETDLVNLMGSSKLVIVEAKEIIALPHLVLDHKQDLF